jgi:hypothetical protein
MIGETQFGFRKGVGTRDAIGVVRMLSERSIEFDNDMYVCFIDFEKAFDRVSWVKMMDVLKKAGIDWRDRRLIRNLYIRQTATVRVGDEYTEGCYIGCGVRQGCCLSPLLFSLYSEMMMVEALGDVEEGVLVGGELIKDIKFADDQAIVASREKGLQKLMDSINAEAKRYDMKINAKKTKVMRISREEGGIDITIDGQKIEQVRKFQYLGSWITDDGKCETEVKARIAMAKAAFHKRRELFTKKMSRKVKKKIIKTLVWSVALYGGEAWTLRKKECDLLESLEMYLWRKMEKISWMEKKTNVEVLQAVAEERHLLKVVMEREKRWIGHVLRGNGLMRKTIEGRMLGKKPRGRPRFGMLEELKEGSYACMKRRAENRQVWRNLVPRTCH